MKIINKNDTKFIFPEIKDTINKYVKDYQCDYDEDGFIYYTLVFNNPLEESWEFEFYLLERETEYTAEDFMLDLEDCYADFSDEIDSIIDKHLQIDYDNDWELHIELIEELIDVLEFKEKQVEALIKELRCVIDSCDDLQKFRRV